VDPTIPPRRCIFVCLVRFSLFNWRGKCFSQFHNFRAEIAKDHFAERGTHEVVGGIISPVHDAYKKKGLVSQTHRLAMMKLALQTSSWIRLSEWESQQEDWTRTRNVLHYHQNYMNSIIRDLNGVNSASLSSWLPPNVKQLESPVQIRLLCGADLLESFATPGLWDKEDVRF
jgi:nicotinamide mononucleotide adenylyltransferase